MLDRPGERPATGSRGKRGVMRGDAIPLVAKDVIARSEADGVLLFHVESDEMYFVPETVAELLMRCDGSRNAAELVRAAAGSADGAGGDAMRVLDELAQRLLVEVWE